MGDLTRNLSRSEFACRCGCGFDTVDFELVHTIQESVYYFTAVDGEEVYVVISGPNRCVPHNKAEGGAENSQHIYARAADYKLFYRRTRKQVDPDRVAEYLEKNHSGNFGIGRYNNRTHLDTRTNGPARWDMR